MKTDSYLNLCLEQAELSPLNHRHGCIVVKGGKVIGKGFNDYRPGFDGGALKSGVLPSKSFALDKLKLKGKGRDDGKATAGALGNNAFKPFEAMADGKYYPHSALSMHSEMMAINSALASSSTMGATTLSCVGTSSAPTRSPTPPSKLLPRRKSNNALARPPVPGGVLKLAPADAARQHHGPQNQHSHYYHRSRQGKQKLQKQNQQKQEQQQKKYQHDYYYYDGNYNQFHCNDTQTQGRQPKPKPSRIERSTSYQLGKFFDTITGDGSPLCKEKSGRGGISGTVKVRNKDALSHRGSRGQELSPAVHSINDRMKNPKLIGADIYIARLGNIQREQKRRNKNGSKAPFRTEHNSIAKNTCCSSLPLEKNTTASSGSLHDELMCKDRKSSSPSSTSHPSRNAADDPGFDRRQLRDSRPCYRCVAYMHSAGIRRCFWTNAGGEWECAKVRDLFAQMSGASTNDDKGGDGEKSASVFITKHEVLMLRRLASGG